MEMILYQQPDVLVMDKGFGVQAVLDWLAHLKSIPLAPAIVVWGVSMTEAEALRFLQAGARGIVRKTTDLQTLLACLPTVAAGKSWMANNMVRESMRHERYPASTLTP